MKRYDLIQIKQRLIDTDDDSWWCCVVLSAAISSCSLHTVQSSNPWSCPPPLQDAGIWSGQSAIFLHLHYVLQASESESLEQKYMNNTVSVLTASGQYSCLIIQLTHDSAWFSIPGSWFDALRYIWGYLMKKWKQTKDLRVLIYSFSV